MSVRWAIESDRPCVLAAMRAAKMGCDWFDYAVMDGTILLDELDGEVRGYIAFTLHRPEAHVRQLAVVPEHQHQGLVARRLLTAFARIALAHGCQGVEAFTNSEEMTDIMTRLGAVVQPGVRLRWPLAPEAQSKAKRWMEIVERLHA